MTQLKAVITGDLKKVLAAEKLIATKAVTKGTRRGGIKARDLLRKKTRALGLAKRGKHKNGRSKDGLAKAWNIAHYPPKGKGSLNSAAYVFSKADRLHGVFIDGATIKANKKWLIIPSKVAIKLGFHLSHGSKRSGEYNWASVVKAQEKFGKNNIAFLQKGNDGVIVAKNATKTGKIRKGKLRKGQLPVVLFYAVKRVKIGRKLDLKAAIREMHNIHLNAILAEWHKLDR